MKIHLHFKNYIAQATVAQPVDKSSDSRDRPPYDPVFWQDPFHLCAFHAYIEAAKENKHMDSEHVRKLAYAKYESRERISDSAVSKII